LLQDHEYHCELQQYIAIDGQRVSFDIELTTPACPVKADFEAVNPPEWRMA
jgi:hypothetical protein